MIKYSWLYQTSAPSFCCLWAGFFLWSVHFILLCFVVSTGPSLCQHVSLLKVPTCTTVQVNGTSQTKPNNTWLLCRPVLGVSVLQSAPSLDKFKPVCRLSHWGPPNPASPELPLIFQCFPRTDLRPHRVSMFCFWQPTAHEHWLTPLTNQLLQLAGVVCAGCDWLISSMSMLPVIAQVAISPARHWLHQVEATRVSLPESYHNVNNSDW